MADIFFRQDFNNLFENKKIVFVGDSNMRALYKDFVQLGLNNSLTSQATLRTKLEDSCNGDRLVMRGRKHNGRDAREERVFENEQFSAQFYFITKCFDDYVVKIMNDVVRGGVPDVIVYNSCIWDITRWGPRGVDVYKQNIPKLMRLLRDLLPNSTLVIWCTALPVSSKSRGGLLIEQVEFLKHTLRFDIMEANLYASKVVDEYGFDVLDVHYYLRYQIHRRTKDGIHWFPESMRHITNLLLTHISLAWNVPLANRFESRLLQYAVDMKDDDVRNNAENRGRPFFHEDVIPNANTPFFTAHSARLPQRLEQQAQEQLPLNPFSVPPQPTRNVSCQRTKRRRPPRKRRCIPRGRGNRTALSNR